MQTGRDVVKKQSDDNALGRIVNKLSAEVKRAGNIRATAPLTVRSDATGITISLASNEVTQFGKLQARLNAASFATVKVYRMDSSNNTWVLTDDIKTVWASPLWGTSDYLAVNKKVMFSYLPYYGKFVVVNAECGA